MSIRDFVKKHKKKLIAASSILASLLAMTQLAGNMNVLNLPPELGYAVDPNYSLNEPQLPIRQILRRERRHSEPTWIPVPYRERRYSGDDPKMPIFYEEESKRPRGGGKSNSLLKAVQAYKKNTDVVLKKRGQQLDNNYNIIIYKNYYI
jgi:hypothetical protein